MTSLLRLALERWGSAVPIEFRESEDSWDFEVIFSSSDSLTYDDRLKNAEGFFPSEMQKHLTFYPEFFRQAAADQERKMLHELGHIFGLRHYFAAEKETNLPSHVFGENTRFSIMNYDENAQFSEADRRDLSLLYNLAWRGELTEIEQTPIRLISPFTSLPR